MKKLLPILFACLLFPTVSSAQVQVVGSSTVFPFATVVAETLSKTSNEKTPIIESTGTGGGMKLFCAGIGDATPDVTNASRSIKTSELENCKKNGVTPIEVKVGYDGIVIANNKNSYRFNFTPRELFLALAKTVPYNGLLVENPYKTWNEINSEYPNIEIEVLGPPPTSGTRDAFLELVMEEGAKSFDIAKKDFKRIAHTMREDGHFIEAGENDNLIVQKLVANPNALGIFGYSFLEENLDIVQGSTVNGSEPTFDNIADGSYIVSRPLYFYVKKEHFGHVSGLKQYVELFVSDKMAGEYGQLLDKGLIPLPNEELKKVQETIKSL